MPKMNAIYTGKGDQGETSLGGGQRVPKDALRVQAYGSVDEANANIGMALAHGLCPQLQSALTHIQNDLFNLGTELAFLEKDKQRLALPSIEARHVERLEGWIDAWMEAVGPLENFILPGGSLGAAQLQLARTVCRRAERDVTSLIQHESLGEFVLPYLNRLSDALFTAGRLENQTKGIQEPYWDSQA